MIERYDQYLMDQSKMSWNSEINSKYDRGQLDQILSDYNPGEIHKIFVASCVSDELDWVMKGILSKKKYLRDLNMVIKGIRAIGANSVHSDNLMHIVRTCEQREGNISKIIRTLASDGSNDRLIKEILDYCSQSHDMINALETSIKDDKIPEILLNHRNARFDSKINYSIFSHYLQSISDEWPRKIPRAIAIIKKNLVSRDSFASFYHGCSRHEIVIEQFNEMLRALGYERMNRSDAADIAYMIQFFLRINNVDILKEVLSFVEPFESFDLKRAFADGIEAVMDKTWGSKWREDVNSEPVQKIFDKTIESKEESIRLVLNQILDQCDNSLDLTDDQIDNILSKLLVSRDRLYQKLILLCSQEDFEDEDDLLDIF